MQHTFNSLLSAPCVAYAWLPCDATMALALIQWEEWLGGVVVTWARVHVTGPAVSPLFVTSAYKITMSTTPFDCSCDQPSSHTVNYFYFDVIYLSYI